MSTRKTTAAGARAKAPKASSSTSAARKAARRNALYAGAKIGRATNDWVFGACSTEQELKQNTRTMRLRARDLERNSPSIGWYLTNLRSNVIGANGPRLQFQVRDSKGNLDKEINRYLEERFADWARVATTDRRQNLPRFLHQGIDRLAIDGERFVRRVVGYPHNEFGFALQLLEPDLLDEQFNTAPAGGRGVDIRLGVQVDEWLAPVAYHFWDDYPGEHGARSVRTPVPADDVHHQFDVQRANQVRGITWLKRILVAQKMRGGYVEGELVSARAGANKIANLRCTDAEAYQDLIGEDGKPIVVDTSAGEYGVIPPGWQMDTFDPTHPSGNFDGFLKGVDREMASGLGMIYSTFANDPVGVSWSNLRAFLLVERDNFAMIQALECGSFLPWIVEGWLRSSMLVGALPLLPSRDWRRYRAHVWRPRGWKWVDPQNEAAGAKLQLGSGMAGPNMILNPQGVDFEDVLEDRQRCRELCEEYGEDFDEFDAAWKSQGSMPANPPASTQGSTAKPTGAENGNDGEAPDPESGDPADDEEAA